MDLSLYLLLAPAAAGKQTPGTDQQPGNKVGQLAWRENVPVFDPLRHSTVGSKRLVQASRSVAGHSKPGRLLVSSAGVCVAIIGNAIGFLALSVGTFILLRIAAISMA